MAERKDENEKMWEEEWGEAEEKVEGKEGQLTSMSCSRPEERKMMARQPYRISLAHILGRPLARSIGTFRSSTPINSIPINAGICGYTCSPPPDPLLTPRDCRHLQGKKKKKKNL